LSSGGLGTITGGVSIYAKGGGRRKTKSFGGVGVRPE